MNADNITYLSAIAYACMLCSAYLANRIYLEARGAFHTMGEVIRMDEKIDHPSLNRNDFSAGVLKMTYYPVIAYISQQGHSKEFKSRVSTNPPALKLGQKIPVFHTPGKEDRLRIVHPLFLMAGPGIIFSFALVLFLISWVMNLQDTLHWSVKFSIYPAEG